MKPDLAITSVTGNFDYYPRWPGGPYQAGGLTWAQHEQYSTFEARLPSGQLLTVSFRRAGSLVTRHCELSISLDTARFDWVKDTALIEARSARTAVDALLAVITPIAKQVIATAKADAVRDKTRQRERSITTARESEARAKAERAAAIRKADGR